MNEIQSPESERKPSFHPLADIFPLMEGEEFDELVGDIKRRGLHEPIVIFEDQVLGRNRVRACETAGVEPHYKEFKGTEEEARRYVISANILRRHLKPNERRASLKTLIKMNPEQSDRSLGRMIKLDKKTVAAERRKMEATGEIPQLKKTVGKDGKSRKRPAKKKTVTSNMRHGTGLVLNQMEVEHLAKRLIKADYQAAVLLQQLCNHDDWRALRAIGAALDCELGAEGRKNNAGGRDIPDCVDRMPREPVTP
jgi:ParB-like chromosome segregation protein Spo0J